MTLHRLPDPPDVESVGAMDEEQLRRAALILTARIDAAHDEYERDRDSSAPRGIITGLALSIPFWATLFLAWRVGELGVFVGVLILIGVFGACVLLPQRRHP